MVFVVVVAALLGCGSGGDSVATSATSTVPPKLTLERLPAGPLPGKPVHGIFRGAGWDRTRTSASWPRLAATPPAQPS
jgi:hypothetical protein